MGRKANLVDINLESTGVETAKGIIPVDPTFQELLKDVIEPWIRDKRILCPRGE